MVKDGQGWSRMEWDMMVAPHRMGSDILRDAVARRSAKRTLLGLSSSSMASLGTRERGSGTSSCPARGESMASQARVMVGSPKTFQLGISWMLYAKLLTVTLQFRNKTGNNGVQ